MSKEESNIQQKSRKKLAQKINDIQKKAYTSILSHVEIAVGNPERYKPLRKQILRDSNNAIREIESEIERSYVVEYVPTAEDVIVFTNKK